MDFPSPLDYLIWSHIGEATPGLKLNTKDPTGFGVLIWRELVALYYSCHHFSKAKP